MEPVAAGDRLSTSDRLVLDKAIRQAEQQCRFEFSVYVGPTEGEDTRAFATRLHRRLVAPDRSVLVCVDPSRRATEVVTGHDVRRHLTDAEVELAVLTMQSDFRDGNLTSGLARGVALLADHARAQNTLHARA